MLGRGVNQRIAQFGPAYPLEELQPLLCGSWFAVNLECAISSQQRQYSGPSKAFYFRADPRAVEVLREAKVRAVSLANNHALDADREGLGETLKILQKNGLIFVGAGRNRAEAQAAKVADADGVRLGLLAACDHQRDFAASEQAPGIRCVAPEDEPAMQRLTTDVATLRQQVDAVIVSWHWQRNWEQTVRPPYRRAARRLVEAGATVVWGHGPHHFQGVERIGDSAVLYSTGDLVDDYATDELFRNDYQLLFRVSLERRPGGGAVAADVRAHPLKLGYARTQPADEPARRWIEPRFRHMCQSLGGSVLVQDGWLVVQ